MIYDLSIPEAQSWRYPLPGEPKTKVLGINLLRTCRQVRAETQDRVWYESWFINLPLSSSESIDLGTATSSLHELALAKIFVLNLAIEVDPNDLSSCGLLNLENLSSFKSLWFIHVAVRWGGLGKLKLKQFKDPTKTTFLRGLVIQIILQIPPHVNVSWSFRAWGTYQEHVSDVLDSIGKGYKYLQGAHYQSKVSKNCEANTYTYLLRSLLTNEAMINDATSFKANTRPKELASPTYH